MVEQNSYKECSSENSESANPNPTPLHPPPPHFHRPSSSSPTYPPSHSPTTNGLNSIGAEIAGDILFKIKDEILKFCLIHDGTECIWVNNTSKHHIHIRRLRLWPIQRVGRAFVGTRWPFVNDRGRTKILRFRLHLAQLYIWKVYDIALHWPFWILAEWVATVGARSLGRRVSSLSARATIGNVEIYYVAVS